MNPAPRVLGMGIAALFVIAVGCSQNAGETVRPPQATSDASGTIRIEAREFSFIPDRAEAFSGAGLTLELVNSGAEQHSLTLYRDEEYTEPVADAVITAIQPGNSETVTFEVEESGVFHFRCEIHPDQMSGELSVG